MVNFEEVLSNAIMMAEGFYIGDRFNLIYPFTTENINGYIDKFDLKGKSLMTIGSSGDQALNAILKGCKDITIIDINSYAKFYYYLKMVGILHLNYNEFSEFFCYHRYYKELRNNKKIFDLEIFNKIKSVLRILDYESFLFFDELFQNFSTEDIRGNIFSCDEMNYKDLKLINTYLINEGNYYQLRKEIKNVCIEFINSDIEEVKLNRIFDNIWLSNLGQYYDDLRSFKYLIDKLLSYLNKEGKMLIAYLFVTNERYEKSFAPIYNLEVFMKLFEGYNAKQIEIESTRGIEYNAPKMRDSVFIYKK